MPDEYGLIVIGGGPAGLAAAVAAHGRGLRDILIVERDKEPGGILNQCVHSGFGLHYFKEELTGPEYAGRFIDMLRGTGIEVCLDTMALTITRNREVHTVSKRDGYRMLKAKAIVLAMGCRERSRGAVGIPGTRPAGVLTAGAAQRYVNMEGYMPGRRVLILGSGDIGLIMARRMALEGAKVLACVEVAPYPGGLNRNIVQCLNDYDIPLYLSHTVTDIRGRRRVESAVVSRVDGDRSPVSGTEMVFDCDTILLSVGLIPENELSRLAGVEIDPRTGGAVVFEDMETSLPGVFACGNAAHVHDLVDFVTEESMRAGMSAARYALCPGKASERVIDIKNGEGIRYTVPQRIRPDNAEEKTGIFFRANRVFGNCELILSAGGEIAAQYRRERVAPGEMERIKLPKKLLEKIAGSTLELAIKEAGA